MLPGVSVTDFLAQVRRAAMIPTNARAFQDDDILSLANNEQMSYIVPQLLKAREEYLVAELVTAGVVSGDALRIPSNAVGRKLKGVQVLVGSAYQELSRLNADIPDTSEVGFTLKNNSIVIHNTSGSIKMLYFRRPGNLISTAAVYTTTATTGTAVVLNSTTGLSVVTGVDDYFDFVSPYDTTNVTRSVIGTTVAGNTLTLATSTTWGINEYVSNAGQAYFVQLPDEVVPLLVSRTALRYLEAVGDPKVTVTKALCEEMEKNLFPMLSPRVEGAPRVIVDRRRGRNTSRWGF